MSKKSINVPYFLRYQIFLRNQFILCYEIRDRHNAMHIRIVTYTHNMLSDTHVNSIETSRSQAI